MSTISVGYGSATFEFKSKYPGLHMPPYPVSSSTLVAPGDNDQLLDGEFVLINSDGKVERGVPSGADDITQFSLHIFHGNPGRSDLQVGEQVPVVLDEAFEFASRLHTGNVDGGTAPVVGDMCYITADDYVDPVSGDAAGGKTLLTPVDQATPGTYCCVARCTRAADAEGWARFFAIKTTVTIPA